MDVSVDMKKDNCLTKYDIFNTVTWIGIEDIFIMDNLVEVLDYLLNLIF